MRNIPRLRAALLAALAIAAAAPHPAHADGYLWLGSEFQGEGNIYRFNLATGMIDLVQGHAGTDHWNNVATDGTSLYLGHPTSDTLNRHDAYSGALVSAGAYSTTLAGHKEDGAFADGSLWRVAFSGTSVLHRTTTAGVAESTFTMSSNPGFVGLEFVADTLFATTYSTRDIGTLERATATTLNFVVRPWATGQEPPFNFGALAYDERDDVLYMATASDRLYRVTFSGGQAFSELVVDLSTVGYPSGGLVDGMGWVAPEAVGVPETRAPRGAPVELAAPWPNPARDVVWFEIRVAEPTAARVGIYDISGRALRTWDLPGLGAGTSRFMWNFRADGGVVPPGIYFVRVSTAGGEVSRRVVRVE
jgi:hypothetical protein